jgi:hypothetical protein
MVMDRALADRDARRMWIALSARGSICDHARARGSHSALVEPRTEKHRENGAKTKKKHTATNTGTITARAPQTQKSSTNGNRACDSPKPRCNLICISVAVALRFD